MSEDGGDFGQLEVELAAREEKLAQLERESSEVRFRLMNLGAGKSMAVGDTASIVMASRYRDKLRGELARKQKHLELIQAEVMRLRARINEN